MIVTKNGLPTTLLVNVVDETARTDPGKTYAILPISTSGYDAGLQTITYRMLANAINGIAWWLTRTLGKPRDFRTLSYIGPNDLGHNILLLGANKAGYKMLFASPRYSPLAHIKLMNSVDCSVMLTPATGTTPLIESIASEHGQLQILQIPSLEKLYKEEHEHFCYEKTFEQASREPLVVVHTSGTTGFPKPVIWTHAWVAAFAQQRLLRPPPGFENMDDTLSNHRLFTLFPPGHAGSLIASLIYPLFLGTTVILPPAGVAAAARHAVDAAGHTEIDVVAFVPPFVEELASDPAMIDELTRRGVKTVSWAGGPVSATAGEALASKVNLWQSNSTTESGQWPTIRALGSSNRDTWKYSIMHPKAGIEFREETDGLYKAFIVRSSDEIERQPIFHLLEDIKEWDSGDLFRKSIGPAAEIRWEHYGRGDDLQIFLTGEKYHAAAAERLIVGLCSDILQEALLIGTGRARMVLLLEPKPAAAAILANEAHIGSQEEQKKRVLLERIWSAVEEINKGAPLYAKVQRDQILFTDPEKPMAKTAKATVQRQQVIRDYEEEIQAVLQGVEPITWGQKV